MARKLPESPSAAGVNRVAGSMIAAIERENPGAGAFRGVFHWFNPMDAKATRHGAVVNEIASNSVTASQDNDRIVETSIPARLDRLRWGGFHTRVVVALGITWILDGLEVTLAGALAGALKESPVLEFTNADVGIASSAYLAGAVLGAVFFGWLTDRLG